jgi:hypothetical protein
VERVNRKNDELGHLCPSYDAFIAWTQRGRTTLAQMNLSGKKQNLSAALEVNPILTMNNSTTPTINNTSSRTETKIQNEEFRSRIEHDD